MFSWQTTLKPIVALAPMAGVTDASFRQFLKSIAPDVIVFTEFISSDAIHFGCIEGRSQADRTRRMLAFDPTLERPFIVQVFGNDLDHFRSACQLIEETGADGIDINMGCPAAKIVSSCHGSALIRRADLAAKIVETTVSAVKIPVSVKTRLGWESTETLIPFCRKLVEAGASALSIHGRTYREKFTGEASWDAIYELKRNVSVPVIGNGDIRSAEDARAKLGNLDGVMIGRASIGNPWVMAQITEALRGTAASTPQTFEERIPFILRHCALALRHKGERRGMLEMRRHFAGYVKGFDGAKELRTKLMRVERLDEVERILTAPAAS